MALTESRWQRVFTLCALYFAQGVPWGFMLITLPNHLAFKFAVGDDDIGKLTAIILVPWTFKLIWAPVVDSFTIRSMGRRRPWIIGAECLMALTLLGFLRIGNPADNLQYLIEMFFLHNVFASLQDVCTDALAVDVLPADEQGRTNGLMWSSKLIGRGVGGWGLSHVLDWGGLEMCVYVQVAILLLIMVVPLWILERPGEKRLPWSPGAASGTDVSNVRSPRSLVGDLFHAFSITSLIAYVGFALLKLIGVGVNEIVTKTLYAQHLEPRWTDVELSTVSGLYAMFTIAIGSVLGGYLGDRYGRRIILVTGFGGYALVAMIYAGCPQLWNHHGFSVAYLICCETLNAIGSVGFLSMAMRISWTSSAATVFTVYMTLSNISHIIGNWLAGPIRSALTFEETYGETAALHSYELTFWFVAAVSLLPLPLLLFVRTGQVDEAEADQEVFAGLTPDESV